MVPQGKRIFSSLSVEENLKIGAKGRGQDWSLERIYNLFPILKERSRLKGGKLSGGEKQMLAIARGLMTTPSLLLLDEPSEGLAPLSVHELAQMIYQFKEEGPSVLLAEQHFSFALGLANFVYVMSKGEIVYQSYPEKLRYNDEIKNRYLGV